MALMTLKVVPTEGDAVAVPVTPKVIVACERHFKKGMGQLFEASNVTYEALAWAAHQAMLQSGYEVKTFDAWLDGIDEITTEDTPEVPL
jgi:hypothetical protein